MNAITISSNPASLVDIGATAVAIMSGEFKDQLASTTLASGKKPAALNAPSDVAAWSDSELISSIRCEPPDQAALDVLVARSWDHLVAFCDMLTMNNDKARDLAQAAWCRLLRNRQALNPDGNFTAYLITIARNLFLDSYRAARRAGPLADYRLMSLDVPVKNDEGEVILLESNLPDLNAAPASELIRLKIDIDMALKRLTPRLREVLVARFLVGESCAEIGLRHGRTEQTISGWIREAIRQMKIQLNEPSRMECGKMLAPEREPT